MVFKLKLFGLRLYVTDCAMKPCNRGVRWRQRKRLRLFREELYRESGGRCMECGRRVVLSECELHHIIPLSVNPNLAVSKHNLRLLCRDCHRREHSSDEECVDV